MGHHGSVDWYLDSTDAHAVSALRREIRDYLLRHGEPSGAYDEAEVVVSELLGNTARHAAGPVWVTLSWGAPAPTIVVRDLGPGFDPDLLGESPLESVDPLQESGRGLLLITALAPALETAVRERGVALSVELPVRRSPELSHDPPRRTTGVLPALEEARPEGGFGKESFLRALVVQLAQALELQRGPDAAEAAVAQVGTDVGGQMEEEYRRAKGVVGRMSPEQLAECYVRLKHAIDGGVLRHRGRRGPDRAREHPVSVRGRGQAGAVPVPDDLERVRWDRRAEQPWAGAGNAGGAHRRRRPGLPGDRLPRRVDVARGGVRPPLPATAVAPRTWKGADRPDGGYRPIGADTSLLRRLARHIARVHDLT